MSAYSISTIRRPVPQSGCIASITPLPRPQNLWQHLMATLGEFAAMADPFAVDVHPDVRMLGRLARQRYPQAATDYCALGDICAWLTLEGSHLNQAYAEKAILAYQRAGECLACDIDARMMIIHFLDWVVEVACTIDTFATVQKSMAVCERALRIEQIASDSQLSAQVRTMHNRLRRQLFHMKDGGAVTIGINEITPERLSRQLCDEGQELLRRHHVAEALEVLARALDYDEKNSKAWLWKALALTDTARFDEAIACYRQAIRFAPLDYGAWNSLGSLLLELGRIDEAMQCFDQALAMPLAPGVVQAAFLLNKGKALYMKRQYQQARMVLEQANALDATPESMSGIIACNEMLGRIQAWCQPDGAS